MGGRLVVAVSLDPYEPFLDPIEPCGFRHSGSRLAVRPVRRKDESEAPYDEVTPPFAYVIHGVSPV